MKCEYVNSQETLDYKDSISWKKNINFSPLSPFSSIPFPEGKSSEELICHMKHLSFFGTLVPKNNTDCIGE